MPARPAPKLDPEDELLIEDNLGDEASPPPFKYSITSYGADFTVDSLVNRLNQDHIYIPTFQRAYIWNLNDASKFVESLLLGLPVPAIFLSRDNTSNQLLVIDGQQRLRTVQYFYDGVFEPTGRRFALANVQSDFKGVSYKTLLDEDRRRLDDSIMHAIIVKQDEPSDDDSSIYQIFERLNTGGRALQPQEIRASIYHGPFSQLLKDLNSNTSWRNIYGPVSPHMRDQELILRSLALYFDIAHYAQPMKEFLNDYMGKNRGLARQSAGELRSTFLPTIELVHDAIGEAAFRPVRALNAAVFDAVMFGLATLLARTPAPNLEEVRQRYEGLVTNEAFLQVTSRATANEENLRMRLELATKAFSAS